MKHQHRFSIDWALTQCEKCYIKQPNGKPMKTKYDANQVEPLSNKLDSYVSGFHTKLKQRTPRSPFSMLRQATSNTKTRKSFLSTGSDPLT